MNFGTGHIPSPEAEVERIRDRPILGLLGTLPSSIPAGLDRRDIAGEVTSQALNDCCIEALDNSIEIEGRATGIEIPKLSRKQPYAFAQLRDQERLGVSFAQRRVRNVGTRFDMLRLALEEHGIASETRCPYEPNDLQPKADGQLDIQVPIDVDIAAAVALLTGDYGVDVDDAFEVLSMALAQSHFGMIAIDVDRAFMNLVGPDAEYDGVKNEADIIGGHAISVVGYRSAVGRSSAALLIKNSYGTAWGDGGYAWLTRSAVSRGRDASIFKAVPFVRA